MNQLTSPDAVGQFVARLANANAVRIVLYPDNKGDEPFLFATFGEPAAGDTWTTASLDEHGSEFGRIEMSASGALDVPLQTIGRATATILSARLDERNTQLVHKLSLLMDNYATTATEPSHAVVHETIDQACELLAAGTNSAKCLVEPAAHSPSFLQWGGLLPSSPIPIPASSRRIAAPLSVRGQQIGELLLVDGPERRRAQLISLYDARLVNRSAAIIAGFITLAADTLSTRQRAQQLADFARELGTLQTAVYSLPDDPQELPHELFESALRLVHTSIPDADAVAIRLADSPRSPKFLFHAQILGQLWATASNAQRTRRFPLRNPPSSLGASVFLSGKPRLVSNIQTTDLAIEATFPEITSLVVVPIEVGDTPLGVLDVMSASRLLTDFDLRLAAVVGSQLGVFIHLRESLLSLRRVHTQQLQAMEDLRHQLVSPVAQAERRTRRLLERRPTDDRLKRELFAIRGLTRKASNVVRSSGAFLELARANALSCRPVTMTPDDLFRLLRESAVDAEVVSKQPIHIYVDKSSLAFSFPPAFALDRSLVEQAVDCLLDNAGKYSFPHSEVDIRATQTRSHVKLLVTSTGVAMTPGTAEICKQRGWRDLSAGEFAGEGSGIGLWIVDKVMQAHGGRLTIRPDGNHTTAELSFPRAGLARLTA